MKQLSAYVLLVIAIVFMAIGFLREEHLLILNKSIRICLECIGIG